MSESTSLCCQLTAVRPTAAFEQGVDGQARRRSGAGPAAGIPPVSSSSQQSARVAEHTLQCLSPLRRAMLSVRAAAAASERMTCGFSFIRSVEGERRIRAQVAGFR